MNGITAEEKATLAAFERRSLANQPDGRDEGLGTTYERVVINNYLGDLAEREGLSRVLEHPADGVTGAIGCNSLCFGANGRDVVLANPVWEVLPAARKHWQDSQQAPRALVAAEVDEFPFADESFDLVWNFCIFERFSRPEVLVAEMARVSSQYVLVMTQNCWNLGTGLHALYHLANRQGWDHGRFGQMAIGAVKRVFGAVGLECVQWGAIDTPPWVDTWDMPMRGYLKRMLHLFGREWEWETPAAEAGGSEEESGLVRFLAWVEDQLPRPTIFWQTHHWYVLGAKSATAEGEPGEG